MLFWQVSGPEVDLNLYFGGGSVVKLGTACEIKCSIFNVFVCKRLFEGTYMYCCVSIDTDNLKNILSC